MVGRATFTMKKSSIGRNAPSRTVTSPAVPREGEEGEEGSEEWGEAGTVVVPVEAAEVAAGTRGLAEVSCWVTVIRSAVPDPGTRVCLSRYKKYLATG